MKNKLKVNHQQIERQTAICTRHFTANFATKKEEGKSDYGKVGDVIATTTYTLQVSPNTPCLLASLKRKKVWVVWKEARSSLETDASLGVKSHISRSGQIPESQLPSVTVKQQPAKREKKEESFAIQLNFLEQ